MVIDASGDADVAARAGVPFEGPNEGGPVQSLTTTFKLINVNVDRAKQVKKDELHPLMQATIDSGDYRLPRKEGSVHITPLAGVMATNMTRVGEHRRDGSGAADGRRDRRAAAGVGVFSFPARQSAGL